MSVQVRRVTGLIDAPPVMNAHSGARRQSRSILALSVAAGPRAARASHQADGAWLHAQVQSIQDTTAFVGLHDILQ
eukprot:COSAG02_NODE_994_length_15358_cov_42.651812_2_plen_76_part_00